MRIRHPFAKENQKIVIIVGGGFAGLAAANMLAEEPEVYVILIDKRNHHLFQPLLYQVATGGLNASDIAVPIRSQFSKVSNVEVHMAQVEAVNVQESFITTERNEILFDFLILACGAHHSYFSNTEWAAFAPGLKTLEDAIDIRGRIFRAFERAENELDLEKQRALLNFAIVGGGPTGVELAGAIADVARTVLIKDFKRINPASARILLLEAGPKILSAFSEDLSRHARNDLEKLGVEVRTGAKVEAITDYGLIIGGEFINTYNVFWAAGVQAEKMNITPSVAMDAVNRIKVEKDFSIPGFPYCFVVGDMATMQLENNRPLPGLAPVAMQAGKHAAKMIKSSLQGLAREPFHYVDKGLMATIGKRKAISQYKSLKMTGYIAWLAWLFIHVYYLVGFKNRVFVIIQWAWSYVFSKRGARLITGKESPSASSTIS
ncbi:MAG TPA: NAD(P)/FAD-dependent oxidoreductase [Pseudobdellovibrionaceae bacterium]|jgi:NADH dehydrogenase